MTLKETIKKYSERLRLLKFETARLDVELIIANYLELERSQLLQQENRPLSALNLENIEKLMARREAEEPVAYILGFRDFYKESFVVRPGVLVPRPETETIVEEAVKWINQKADLKILDLGCGSGCIGLSIIKETSAGELQGVDISSAAIEISRLNAKKLNVESRCNFTLSNVLSLKGESVDLVVANPPYLDKSDSTLNRKSLNFEPQEALYSREQGFFDIKEWLKKSAEILKPSGLLLMEIGYNQGDLVREFLNSMRLFSEFKILRDLAGHERVIRAIK